MTGQAARRALVSVEKIARNLDDAEAPDNRRCVRGGVKIAPDAPERLETQAPTTDIARAIRDAGVAARISRNAGGFVCNHLYFAALRYLGGQPQAKRAVFLHLPATPEQTPPNANYSRLSPEAAARALKAAAVTLMR